MKGLRAKLWKRCGIEPQPVGDNPIRKVPLLFQKLPHRIKGRTLVSARMGQDFKNFALIVYGTPSICPLL